MSWEYSAYSGSNIDPAEPRTMLTDFTTRVAAYAAADLAFDAGASRVSIILKTPHSHGLADTRERGKYGGEWVVGESDWAQSEATGVGA